MASNPAFWTASMRLGCGVAVWLLAGCNLESGFFEKSTTEESTWRGKLGQQVTNVDVVASEEDAGVVTAALDSNATTTQVALAAADSAISGAQVAFPPGALGISTSISLQEGQSLAAAGFATELGLGTGVSQAAPALMVMPKTAQDAVQPFTVALPLPSGSGLALADTSLDRLVVFYKVQLAADGKTMMGMLPAALLTVVDGVVRFETQHFGIFQAVYTTTVVVASAKVEKATEKPILAKGESDEQAPAAPAPSPSPNTNPGGDPPPPTVTISLPAADTLFNDQTMRSVTVSGACTPVGSQVTLAGAASGSTSCTATGWTTNVSLLSAGQGSLTITAVATAGGISSTAASRTIVKDSVPPDSFSINTVNTGVSPIVLTWSTSAGAERYQVVIGSTSGCATAVETFANVTLKTVTLTTATSGTYYACVKAYDQAGNYQVASNYNVTFQIPPPSPTLTISLPAADTLFNDQTMRSIGFSGACTPIGSVVTLSGAATSSTTCTASGWTATVSLQAAPEGANTVTAVATNSGVSSQPVARTVIKDSIQPSTFAINTVNAAATPIAISWSTSSGAVRYQAAVATMANCTTALQSFPNLSLKTATLTTLVAGTYYVCVKAYDEAGNYQSASNSNLTFQVVGAGSGTESTSLPTLGAPTARVDAKAVAMPPSRMLVFGGMTGNGLCTDHGQFNGTTWETTSTANEPSARVDHTVIWTGARAVVFGGHDGNAHLGTGGVYDPIADAWETTTAVAPRARHTAVWDSTTSKMYVFGGYNGTTYLNTGNYFDPDTDVWTDLSTGGAPSARADHGTAATSTQMFVWGGTNGTTCTNTGGRLTFASKGWSSMSTTGAPTARKNPTLMWDGGSKLIVWGGISCTTNAPLNDGAIYDIDNDVWNPMAVTNAPTARLGYSAVWTGTHMFIWGGWDGFGYSGTVAQMGVLYNPIDNTWTTHTSGPANAERHGHVGIYNPTTQKVWVWGGDSGVSGTPSYEHDGFIMAPTAGSL